MPPRNKPSKKLSVKPTGSRSTGRLTRANSHDHDDIPSGRPSGTSLEQVREPHGSVHPLDLSSGSRSPIRQDVQGDLVPEDEIEEQPPSNPLPTSRANEGNPRLGSTDRGHDQNRMYNLEKKVMTMENSMNERLDEITMHIKTSTELMERALGSKSRISLSDHGHAPEKKEKSNSYVRPMEAYVQVMERRLPLLDVVFSDYILPRCVYNIFITKIVGVLSPGKETVHCAGLTRHCLEVLDALSFSVKSEDPKTVFGTSGGRLASLFRKEVMICALSNARKDTFKAVRGGGKSPTRQVPTWLSRRVAGNQSYISTDHILLVQKMKESKMDTKSAFNDRARIASQKTATRKDDGTYAMRYLYSAVTRTLTRGRREMAQTFFMLVGFLFVDWKNFPSCNVNESDVQLTWAAQVPREGLKLDVIPDMITFSSNDVDLIQKNKEMVQEFSKSRTELQLCTEHDVIVLTKRGRNRAHVPSTVHPKPWRRAISLMDVVVVMVHKICGFDCTTSIYEMVGYHRKSMIGMYILGLVFREMLHSRETRCVLGDDGTSSDHTLSEQVASGSGSSGSTNPFRAESDQQYLNKLWELLLPTPNAQDDILRKCTCQVLDSQYKAEMIQTSTDGHESLGEVEEEHVDALDDHEGVLDGEQPSPGADESYDW